MLCFGNIIYINISVSLLTSPRTMVLYDIINILSYSYCKCDVIDKIAVAKRVRLDVSYHARYTKSGHRPHCYLLSTYLIHGFSYY